MARDERIAELEEKFLGRVRGIASFERVDGVQLETGCELLAQCRRQIAHLLEGIGLLLIDPLQDLVSAIGRLVEVAQTRGEFLAALNAEPVWKLFGRPGLGVKEMPAVNQPVGAMIGYHIRTGKHDVTAYDWEQYLDFADKHLGAKK